MWNAEMKISCSEAKECTTTNSKYVTLLIQRGTVMLYYVLPVIIDHYAIILHNKTSEYHTYYCSIFTARKTNNM